MPIGFKDITYPAFYSNRGHQRRLRRPTTVSAFSNFHLSSCRGCFEIFVLYNGQQGLQHVPLGEVCIAYRVVRLFMPARRSRSLSALVIYVFPTFSGHLRAPSTRSPLVKSAFALYVHQAVALHLGSTSPSSPTSSSHLHQPCSPCSPQQFITGFPRLPRAGFHHLLFTECVLQHKSPCQSAPIC